MKQAFLRFLLPVTLSYGDLMPLARLRGRDGGEGEQRAKENPVHAPGL